MTLEADSSRSDGRRSCPRINDLRIVNILLVYVPPYFNLQTTMGRNGYAWNFSAIGSGDSSIQITKKIGMAEEEDNITMGLSTTLQELPRSWRLHELIPLFLDHPAVPSYFSLPRERRMAS